MYLLIIYDFLINGKGGSDFICNNLPEGWNYKKIRYNEIKLDDPILKEHVGLCIFDYNEEGICTYFSIKRINYNQVLTIRKQLIKISRYIKENYPKIRIINDPENNSIYAYKFELYEKIRELQLNIKVADNHKILELDDLDKVKYPGILILSRSSGGQDRQLCHTPAGAKKFFRALKSRAGPANEVIYIQYIPSNMFGYHISARIIIYEKKIIYYFPRLSKHWIVNQNTQLQDPILLLKAFVYLDNLIKNTCTITDMVSELSKIANGSIYAADILLSNGEVYLCEIGYKFFPAISEP